MQISALAATSGSEGVAPAGTVKPVNPLDGSTFMLMLMAQLKNQNPMDPMDDKDMMGQVAQLNSLETLKDIKDQMAAVAGFNQTAYGASLIGKTISATYANGEEVSGVVTATTIKNGNIYLQVGDNEVPLSAVGEIKEVKA